MKPKFEPTGDGLEIIDRIERRRYRLTTHEPVVPDSVEPERIGDRIPFPIDAVVRITTDRITLPTNDGVYVRDETGSMIAEVQPTDQTYFPRDEYLLDLSGPLKVYVHLEGAVHVYSDTDRTHIAFDESTHATIGARSFHKRPAATVTTTSDPTDVMRAVSTFGSALKTTSPERSYPTLRGHPPRLELGDTLTVPDGLEPPKTGVRIEIPPSFRYVFAVSPLAYYLGATVVPGTQPRIVTDAGYAASLDGEDEFEAAVERVLKQVFFLDCVVRTEGSTPLPLSERRAVEPSLEFDIASAYDRPLADRLETYLDVPYTAIESHIPEWRLRTQLEPTAETVEFLPFVADDLAIIEVREENRDPTSAQPQEQIRAIADFTRTPRDGFVRSADPVRGDPAAASPDGSSERTIQQSWNGIDSSEIASTTPLSAFQNSIGRTPREDPIEITVVCNDSDMEAELETVNGTYGTRKELPFDVTVRYDLSRAELAETLARESDFFHYIGHIDQEGFQCSDGKLDAESVETVGAKAFLLNACRSHGQGLQLVDAGSVGGIVTLSDIVNTGAVSMGSTIARLLNRGFPLYAALDIARKETIVGQQYLLVGDGMTTIAQPESAPPNVCLVNRGENGFVVRLTTYESSGSEKGSLYIPYLESADNYSLVPGQTEQVTISATELEEFLGLEDIPILVGNDLYWNEGFELDAV